MAHKLMISCGAAALSLAAVATPALAWTHHHSMHSAMHGPSTPAERAQTADLNRQQLAQTQNSTAATSTATQSNSLATEPASYQRSGGSAGMNGSTSAGSTMATGTGAGAGEDQNIGAPSANKPTELQGNPGGTVSPPPTNPSTTPQ